MAVAAKAVGLLRLVVAAKDVRLLLAVVLQIVLFIAPQIIKYNS